MEEASFDDLHQAAVAGAEGTAWTMLEFPACSAIPAYYSTFPSAPPFESFSTHQESNVQPSSPVSIPNAVKEEPAYLDLLSVPSSPPQPSLCSLSSEESFVHTTSAKLQNNPITFHCNKKNSNIPSSPVSNISKQRSSSRIAVAKRQIIQKSSLSDSHFSTHDLADLKGTTAARSRKMTEEERRIMLHKRRLRNRASAARSREKRSRTLMDLTAEVEQLIKKTAALAEQTKNAVEEARNLKAHNVLLAKENEILKAELNM